MSIKSKILRELEKKPRTMKELKNKLGNDKKVARTVDELRRDNRVQRTRERPFRARSSSWRRGSDLPARTTAPMTFSSPAAR